MKKSLVIQRMSSSAADGSTKTKAFPIDALHHAALVAAMLAPPA
jgi:hypothetical protein